jgi:hypothetical protein
MVPASDADSCVCVHVAAETEREHVQCECCDDEQREKWTYDRIKAQ